MGDKIEFPLNSQRYFEQALQFLENQQYEKAVVCLEKVYATEKTTQINHIYTVILYTLDRVEEALEIASELKEFYMKNEKETVFYTMLLIKNHLFLEAEVLIQNHLSNNHSPYKSEWQNANKELVLERENVHFQMELEKKETIKALNEIENYSPSKQTEIIQNARQLNLPELQRAAQTLFLNTQVLPATQKAFLELLIEKEDTNNYLFQWLDGPRQIVPKQLKTFQELSILEDITDSLGTKLEKNPTAIEIIYTEMLNDLLLLYPFVEEIVTDANYWVDSYLKAFNLLDIPFNDPLPVSKEEQQMEKWLNYFNQLAHRK